MSYIIRAISFSNFSNYKARFSMPGGAENMFYSLDLGPVHFVIVSTGHRSDLEEHFFIITN